jgi:glycosyltransferase involved in cell wall biosynthesis
MGIIDLQGGAGVVLRRIAQGLKRFHPDEFHISLLLFRPKGLLPGDAEVFDRINVTGSHLGVSIGRPFCLARHLRLVRRFASELRPDLTFSAGTYANLIFPLALPGVPSLLTVHSHTTQMLAHSPGGAAVAWLTRKRYPLSSVVVVPSIGVAEDLRGAYGVQRIAVIPHGVDIEQIRHLADHAAPDIPSGPYVVACGRLTPAKDYRTLLTAYAKARAAGITHTLLILGDGELRRELLALAKDLSISDHTIFLGHRDNPFPYIRAADAYALSSVWEGYGLALLEAMALGRPCVATDCRSGPGEILQGGEAGLLVPAGDVAGLSNALHRLLTDPALRQHMREKAAKRAAQLSYQRMILAYRELILEHVR